MGIAGARSLPMGEHRDALGRRVAAGAFGADGVGVAGLGDVLDEVADEAAALDVEQERGLALIA